MKQFVKDVNNKITKLNKSSTKEAGFVTAKNGEKVLRISKMDAAISCSTI